MTLSEVNKYFDTNSKKIAEMLGIEPQAVYQWKGSIPAVHQWAIAFLSNFELKPDESILPASINLNYFDRGSYTHNEEVSKLLKHANELARNGRSDVIKAMRTMAEHQQ